MRRQRRRSCCTRWITLLALVVALPASAAAEPLDAARILSGYASGLREGPHWLGRAQMRVAIPLPAPGFDSRLRWAIQSAAPAPAPPAATLTGWLPNLLLVGTFAAVQFALDVPKDSRWSERNGFDREIRDGLKGNSRSKRRDARNVSNAFLYGMYGLLVGDWLWLREEYGFARSIQVDTRWLLGSNITTRVVKVSAGRERPYVRPCRGDPDYVSSCGGSRGGNASFFSGHASNTATVAGLVCARHLGRQERSLVDVIACGGAAAGALTTGIFRMMSERHWATDTLTGWAVGAVFGYVLPRHFDYGGSSGDPLALSSVMPVVGDDYYGLQYGFRF